MTEARKTRIGYTLAALAMTTIALLVYSAPADAHRWSYSNALVDARYSILASCGGGWYYCYQRWDPVLVACTEHSWCWGYNHSIQYTERHNVTQYAHDCHQHAKQYHGGVYVEATDICGAMHPKRSASRVALSLPFRWFR